MPKISETAPLTLNLQEIRQLSGPATDLELCRQAEMHFLVYLSYLYLAYSKHVLPTRLYPGKVNIMEDGTVQTYLDIQKQPFYTYASPSHTVLTSVGAGINSRLLLHTDRVLATSSKLDGHILHICKGKWYRRRLDISSGDVRNYNYDSPMRNAYTIVVEPAAAELGIHPSQHIHLYQTLLHRMLEIFSPVAQATTS